MRALLFSTVLFFFACDGAIVAPVIGPGDPHNPLDPPQPVVCTAAQLAEPGRVTIRRLNRYEYDATVRDLLGDTSNPALEFPNDDFGRGYDNLGEVLSTSPLLVEKWQTAAEQLTTTILDAEMVQGQTTRIPADTMTATQGGASGNGAWNLSSNGTLSTTINFVASGQFTLRVGAYEQHAGTEVAKMRLAIDGTTVIDFDVAAVNTPAVYTAMRTVTAGMHTVAVSFLNDFYMAPDDRNLVVAYVEVTRPGSVSTTANAKLLSCDPVAGGDTCIRDVLGKFARRAWRRPVSAAEVDKLFALTALAKAQGDDVRTGLTLAVEAVLFSPNFLYRPEPGTRDEIIDLTPHELATRLSYFLWGSMPDPELDSLADDGTLMANLEPQITRMLKDPKASAMVTQFAGSWLWSRAAADTMLPAAVKSASMLESQRFFQTFLDEDKSALELLGSNFTFVNDPLATHYGLPLPGGTTLTRVTVDGQTRGHVLGQAATLTVTSHETRTSPVKRGKWVLSQLLCSEPPPPPPGIPAFMPQDTAGKSRREQMEAHRTNPTCASCHAVMDPLGFGLENYDHEGRWRTVDEASFTIDPSGKLPDGRTFAGPGPLAAMLKDDARFPKCLSEQLFIYGLGRDVRAADRCGIAAAAESFKGTGYRLPQLIVTLVKSPAFTQHRGEAP